MNQAAFFWGVLLVAFWGYHYLLFELSDSILEKPKIKKWQRIPVALVNTIFIYAATQFEPDTTAVSYLILILLLLAEFRFFYGDTFPRVILVALTFPMHIMGIRTVSVAIISLFTRQSFYSISSHLIWLLCSLSITFILGGIAILCVIKLIPAKSIKIVTHHSDQLWFVSVWFGAVTLFFLFSTSFYSSEVTYRIQSQNLLVMSAVSFFGVYIMLFFVMKTSDLLGYKEKSEELAVAVYEEQQFRESVLSDAISTFEYNISQDKAIKFVQNNQTIFADGALSYCEIISRLVQEQIHPDDKLLFLHHTSIDTLLSAFDAGKLETVIEYRRLFPNEEWRWVRAFTSLMQDTTGADIKGFTYVKDIHAEKLLQIELKYKAERDSLTGLYNKGMTQNLIAEFIGTKTEYSQSGALFIIDVDNFKTVNDRLGHTFGDVVLCELSEKLRRVFRSAANAVQADQREDIIGRVGGDEFMVFVKGTGSSSILSAKAAQICKAFHNSYKANDGNEYWISASIGIAIFPENGKTFDELYKSADIALYLSKNKGKNAFIFYQGEEFAGYESKRGEIDVLNAIPQKSFSQNRVEYVFKILFNAENLLQAVQSVLQLLASSMNFSRGYIFETSEDGQSTSNTFEWCADGVSPEIDNLQNVPIEAVETSTNAFYSTGRFILASLNELPPNEREVLEPQGIKSMLQFGLFSRDKLIGFIGFDDCVKERIPSAAEIDEMTTLCNVLATFILKERAAQHIEQLRRQ